MHSPTEKRRYRRRFRNCEGYRKIIQALQADFPEIEVDQFSVSGGTFSTPHNQVSVWFNTPDGLSATLSGDPSGQSVSGEVTDRSGETTVIHTYTFDRGELSIDRMDFSEIES